MNIHMYTHIRKFWPKYCFGLEISKRGITKLNLIRYYLVNGSFPMWVDLAQTFTLWEISPYLMNGEKWFCNNFCQELTVPKRFLRNIGRFHFFLALPINFQWETFLIFVHTGFSRLGFSCFFLYHILSPLRITFTVRKSFRFHKCHNIEMMQLH